MTCNIDPHLDLWTLNILVADSDPSAFDWQQFRLDVVLDVKPLVSLLIRIRQQFNQYLVA